jgi:DnaJ homolog subfamily C member 28
MRGIDEIIRNAMEEGAFDNLRGKGQPLNLDENPNVDPEWQLAYHLMKQNGFAPEFIEQRQAIEMELAQARTALARSWAWRQQSLAAGEDAEWVEREWGKAKQKLGETVNKLNAHLKSYNLNIPLDKLYRKPISMEEELALLGVKE